MLRLPPRPDRHRQRPYRRSLMKTSPLGVELLEDRCLLSQGVTSVIGAGNYVPPAFPNDPHDFHITGISPGPVNGVIELANGTTSTSVTLSGYVLGPPGTQPGDFHGGEQVFVSNKPKTESHYQQDSNGVTVDPGTGRPRIDFTLTVDNILSSGANTLRYSVSALGVTLDVSGLTGTVFVDDVPSVTQTTTTPLSVLYNTPLTGNVFDNLTYSDADQPNGKTALYPSTTSGPEITPRGGTFTLQADGSFTYAPPANYTGQDTFSFRVSDGVTTPVDLTQRVDVENDLPTLVSTTNFQLSVPPGGQPVQVTAGIVAIQDSDDSIDKLVFSLVSAPRTGSCSSRASRSRRTGPSRRRT